MAETKTPEEVVRLAQVHWDKAWWFHESKAELQAAMRDLLRDKFGEAAGTPILGVRLNTYRLRVVTLGDYKGDPEELKRFILRELRPPGLWFEGVEVLSYEEAEECDN